MTRGRNTNTVHIVAESTDQARQIWVDTFSRDQADLGPAVAAQRAQVDADRYAPQRPLTEALADLRAAWTVEADTYAHLGRTQSDLDQLREFMALKAEREIALAPLASARDHADQAAVHASKQAERLDQLLDAVTTQYANQLTQHWEQQRPDARDAARAVLAGSGRFGLHRRTVHDAQDELGQWADNWRPIVTHLPTDADQLAHVAAGYDTARSRDAISAYARAAAEHAHPEHHTAHKTVKAATEQTRQAEATYRQAAAQYDRELARYGRLAYTRHPEARLAHAEEQTNALTSQHDTARQQITALLREPALRSLSPERIQAEHDTWQHDRNTQHAAQQRAAHAAALAASQKHPSRRHDPTRTYSSMTPPQNGNGISR